eukprot:1440576-Amphidinium_carterae.1
MDGDEAFACSTSSLHIESRLVGPPVCSRSFASVVQTNFVRGACDDEECCFFASLATALVGPRGSPGRASKLGQLVLGYLFEAGFLVLCLSLIHI